MHRFGEAASQLRSVVDESNKTAIKSLPLEGVVLRVASEHQLAMCLTGLKRDEEAARVYEGILDGATESPKIPEVRLWIVRTKSNYCLLLCTSNTLKDEKLALKLGRDAVEEFASEWETHHAFAAALAESHDFEKAVLERNVCGAIQLTPRGFNHVTPICASRGYKSHRTLREQWASSDELTGPNQKSLK